MALQPIPTEEATFALDNAADELRGLVRFTDFAVSNEFRDRCFLAALVLQDLALNIRAGVSRLVRSDSGAVFIYTAAIDLDNVVDETGAF